MFLGAAAAFLAAALATPVGVSGAFLLVPLQISVLGVPPAQAVPTNLQFNLISIPAGVARFRLREKVDRELVSWLLLGSIPGVVVGVMVKTWVLTDPTTFLLVVAAVLAPIGAYLLLGVRQREETHVGMESVSHRAILLTAAFSGVVGGVYGIGGGSIVAPVLVLLGFSFASVAPAALIVTFVTSGVGLCAFVLLAIGADAAYPDWALGFTLGLGGALGSYAGAALQGRASETALRRILGTLAIVLATGYAVNGIG